MILAAMVAADEDSLVCDYAETYHIYNYRALPLRYAAVLASGLRDDSRIKMIISKSSVSADTMLSAVMADALNTLVWMQTKDARRGRNRPKSIARILAKSETDIVGFDTAEEFNKARAKLIKG